MTTVLSFVSQSSGKKYKVLGLDKTQDPPMLTLQGEHAKFEQPFDKDLFKQCGYNLIKEEVLDQEDDHD
jgi:hypothetical protein